jgi:transposase
VTDSTKSDNFVTFLGDLVVQTPPHLDLHYIADNLHAHKTSKLTEFLETNPRVHIHHTPTHASWLNQVERFFSILEGRVVRRGEFNSVDDPADKVIDFIYDYNRRAAPFRWTYDGKPSLVA